MFMLRITTVFAVSLFALSMPAFAQATGPAVAPVAAPTLRSGILIVSSDGRRIGVIDSVVGDKASPTAVKVIKDMHVVIIPVSSLSAGDKGRVVTTLAYKEIR
jgi:hypothetical protein